jgi:hypothetical protein
MQLRRLTKTRFGAGGMLVLVLAMQSPEELHKQRSSAQPRKGDRIELVLPRLGVPVRGTVYHVDQLQILVKWDDGRSEGLRSSFADRFRIIEGERG